MKAFLPATRVGEVVEPEADQQVRGEADAFPADEEDQQRAAQHEQQHEEQEQVQVGEEAAEALVVRHVADRVDVDHRADAGDDQHHDRGQAVEVEGDVEAAAADQRPAVGGLDQRGVAAGLQVEHRLDREREGQQRQAAADHGDEALADEVAAELRGEHAVQQEAEQRQQDDGGEHAGMESAFEVAVGVEVERALVADQQQHDRDGQRDLGGGHDEDQEHEHRAGGRGGLLREGDQAQVDAVEHQLHAHQHHQHVAADDHAEQPEREQADGDREQHLRPIHGASSCRSCG